MYVYIGPQLYGYSLTDTWREWAYLDMYVCTAAKLAPLLPTRPATRGAALQLNHTVEAHAHTRPRGRVFGWEHGTTARKTMTL